MAVSKAVAHLLHDVKGIGYVAHGIISVFSKELVTLPMALLVFLVTA